VPSPDPGEILKVVGETKIEAAMQRASAAATVCLPRTVAQMRQQIADRTWQEEEQGKRSDALTMVTIVPFVENPQEQEEHNALLSSGK